MSDPNCVELSSFCNRLFSKAPFDLLYMKSIESIETLALIVLLCYEPSPKIQALTSLVVHLIYAVSIFKIL